MKNVALEPKISCVKDRDDTTRPDHRDTGNRADPYTEPNTCFSDSSDSLNSMKVLLHLEKTRMWQQYLSEDIVSIIPQEGQCVSNTSRRTMCQ